jgi:hypothetical protein
MDSSMGPNKGRVGRIRAGIRWHQSKTGDLSKRYGTSRLADYAAAFPTPTSYDADLGGPGNHYRGLGWSARHAWPTVTVHDGGTANLNDHYKGLAWMARHTHDSPDVQHGMLNPTWVEWLMGYPSGWTDADA